MNINSTLESFRDTISNTFEAHLSILSNKMNEVMQKLTLIATIFIPLTFVTGWYGMNFLYMPELKIWWAYPLVLFVMLLIGLAIVLYFKKKNWL